MYCYVIGYVILLLYWLYNLSILFLYLSWRRFQILMEMKVLVYWEIIASVQNIFI